MTLSGTRGIFRDDVRRSRELCLRCEVVSLNQTQNKTPRGGKASRLHHTRELAELNDYRRITIQQFLAWASWFLRRSSDRPIRAGAALLRSCSSLCLSLQRVCRYYLHGRFPLCAEFSFMIFLLMLVLHYPYTRLTWP
jgi:hypothetical protein